MLLSHPEVFPGHPTAPNTMAAGYTIHIETGDAEPIRVGNKGRRVPEAVKLELRDTIQFWYERGIISPSQSPWSAPIVVAYKKDGSLRTCIDYRKLNNVTRKNAYALPNINDILQSLHGAKWFSSLDLASGYHQLPLSPNSRQKTAFTPPWGGLWEFNRAPFGLTSLPGQFSRLMAAVLHKAVGAYAQVFLDDMLIYSETFEEHLVHVEEVLKALGGAGLQIAHHKCALFRSSLKYTGQVVGTEGRSIDPAKLSAIAEMRVPRDKKDVKSVLGGMGYHRQFIRGYASIAEPLQKLLSADVPFEWGEGAAEGV